MTVSIQLIFINGTGHFEEYKKPMPGELAFSRHRLFHSFALRRKRMLIGLIDRSLPYGRGIIYASRSTVRCSHGDRCLIAIALLSRRRTTLRPRWLGRFPLQ